MLNNNSSYISLYFHWPFCTSKCPYCDFNSHVKRTISEEEWLLFLKGELRRLHRTTLYTHIRTIFFGGGTPSLMQPQTVESILNFVSTLWIIDSNVEITLEANPGSVDIMYFKGYRSAGINRISLGLQSFDETSLSFLGRKHSIAENYRALEMTKLHFSNFSFDLIYCRKGQILDAWQSELDLALSFEAPHLSLYQLTIEPNTAFAYRTQKGAKLIPPADEAATFFEITNYKLDEAGYEHYEVSNFSKPGFECQHNLVYWQYNEYFGIGPGAHGRYINHKLSKLATEQIKQPLEWKKSCLNNDNGDHTAQVLDLETQFQEQILMGLRLTRGVDMKCLVRPFTHEENEKVNRLCEEGYLKISSSSKGSLDILSATTRGFLVLNSITSYIL